MMRVLSSTWFAITLLALIFLYSSVGSAVPPVRQGALADWLGWEALRFEMSEMQWFCSPVFLVLVALFCLSMAAATVRRIPLNVARLGEWVVHLGVLVMVVGCFVYFGRKIEGDAVVYKRAAIVSVPGSAPAKMVVRPGATVAVGTGSLQYRVSVNRIAPRHEVPVGPDKGTRTTAVWFGVQRLSGEQPAQFTRVVLTGYPSLTEDVAANDALTNPGGRGIYDTNLRIDLDYEPQDTFFLEHTAAIYARFDSAADWVEMPVRGLPRYYEHLSDTSDIRSDRTDRMPPLRPLDIAALPADAASPEAKALAGISFRAVGYLPYAQLQSHYVPGGNQINPVIRFSLPEGHGRRTYELAAFDPTRNHIGGEGRAFQIDFRWASTPDERERIARKHNPRLEFRLAGKDTPIVLPLGSLLDKGPQTLPGTDYKVTVASRDVLLDFPLMSDALRGTSDDVVIVSIERGDTKFRRLVFAKNPEQSRDLSEMHTPLPELADRGLQIRFIDPAPSGATLIGGPADRDCEILISAIDGTQTRRSLPVGATTMPAESAAPLTIDALIPRAVPVTLPSLVPRNQRQPLQNVGAAMSLLNVEVDDGKQKQRVWLPFNRYAFPDATYAYGERFQYGSYAPKTVTLADGRELELLYSRERRYLPAAIALEQFVLETHPGGQRERDFVSQIRFYEKDHWSPVCEVRSNQPGRYGGLWFFQSEWDPRNEALTVLGVGNRQGIGIMLTGVLLSILGMLYSFYLKPIILRRRMVDGATALSRDATDAATAATKAGPSAEARHKKSVSTALGLGMLAATATLLGAGRAARADAVSFARDVDLSRIRLAAVQHDGRFKPFDTLARETIQQITGDAFFDGQDPVFTYLDLMLNPASYTNRNLIRVKKARVRESLIKAAGPGLSEAEASYIRQTKRISPRFLSLPGVQQELEALESDTMNTGRDADLIRLAQAYADPRNLRGFLRLVPSPGGTPHAQWLSIDELADGPPEPARLAPALRIELLSNWSRLETAWRGGDAEEVNQALNTITTTLTTVEPSLYPDHSRLATEQWYFRHRALTGVWFIYFAAFLCLLPAFLRRNNLARRIGMLAFFVAFVLQTLSIGVRWYLAGRIPTANMFEAVTAAAWCGAAIALILEVWLRRRPMRNLFALGASFCAALALMCGYYMPTLLSANISNPMPILNTVWLKIHVSLILVSYILIGLSFVTATLYLVLRAAARLSHSERLSELWAGTPATEAVSDRHTPPPDGDTATGLPFGLAMGDPPSPAGSAVARRPSRPVAAITGTVLSLAGVLILAMLLRPEIGRTIAGLTTAGSVGTAIGRGLYVLLLAVTVLLGPAFAVWLLAGTARVIFGRDDVARHGRRAPLAAVLDGTTMLLIEGAFVTLWIGIILGAAWADVSWGRPWGWDPKEVFALNTWLIFVGLIHVRLNVRDKGLWTAVLAVAGFAVMMFNWVGVNYFIVGLHSYA